VKKVAGGFPKKPLTAEATDDTLGLLLEEVPIEVAATPIDAPPPAIKTPDFAVSTWAELIVAVVVVGVVVVVVVSVAEPQPKMTKPNVVTRARSEQAITTFFGIITTS
jgi:hypothetical protein